MVLLTSETENEHGFYVTTKGRYLLAKLAAGNGSFVITDVMVGTGQLTPEIDPYELQNLIAPLAAATSTEAMYDKDTVKSTIQYRSDLNGGLDSGRWIYEYGIFARTAEQGVDSDEGRILFAYGALEQPQWVCASGNGVDVRNFPYSIIIGDKAEVYIDYAPEAWMTAEDVSEYCRVVVLPLLLEECAKLIAIHDASVEAHPFLMNLISANGARLDRLELMCDTNVTGNPFVVTFGTLDGVIAEGVWNKTLARIEF